MQTNIEFQLSKQIKIDLVVFFLLFCILIYADEWKMLSNYWLFFKKYRKYVKQ